MNYTEKLNKVKELFSQIGTALAGPAPEAPAPNMPAGNQYTLSDGTPVTIEELEVGKPVTINGQPAPEGTHTLQDGTQITVDASGIISAITPAIPEEMKQVPTVPADNGTSVMEQRIKALEEQMASFLSKKNSFEAQSKEADQKVSDLSATVKKYGEIMPQIFEMLAELGNAPAANPIPEVKISKADQKEASLQKFASAVKELAKSN